MATTRFDITFEDGREETFKVKPRHLIEYEDIVGDIEQASSVRSAFTLAWIAAGKPGTFDEWIATVDDIENPDAAVAQAEVNVEGGAAEPVPTA